MRIDDREFLLDARPRRTRADQHARRRSRVDDQQFPTLEQERSRRTEETAIAQSTIRRRGDRRTRARSNRNCTNQRRTTRSGRRLVCHFSSLFLSPSSFTGSSNCRVDIRKNPPTKIFSPGCTKNSRRTISTRINTDFCVNSMTCHMVRKNVFFSSSASFRFSANDSQHFLSQFSGQSTTTTLGQCQTKFDRTTSESRYFHA